MRKCGYGDPIPQGSHVYHADSHTDLVPYHHPYRMRDGTVVPSALCKHHVSPYVTDDNKAHRKSSYYLVTVGPARILGG